MKQRVLSAALAICLCISSPLVAYAAQEDPLHQGNVLSEKTQEETVPNVDEPNAPAETEPGQEDVPEEEIPGEEIPEETVPGVNEPNTPEETEPGQDDVPEEEIPGQTNPGADEPTTPVEAVPEQENILPEEIPVEAVSLVYPSTLMTTRDSSFPAPTEIYESMIALKDQDQYKEGTVWTNDEPYSDSKGYYHWNGGLLNGKRISAVGCVAFAFTLSDAAFGSWPARIYAAGEFLFEDIKAGDILQVNNDVHTVIVLNVSDVGVVVAEGNMSTGDHVGKVHWGRTISKEEVVGSTSHYITRYPEGYISPDDPEADTSIASGTLAGGLAWNLTKAGILTISGKGAMPDFSSVEEQPWSDNNSQIQKIVIGDGVTNIGSGAF